MFATPLPPLKLVFVSFLLSCLLASRAVSCATVPLNNSALVFTPNTAESWSTFDSVRSLGSSVHSTTTAGATISFSFRGHEVTVIGGNAGPYSITLDGQSQTLSPSAVAPNLISHNLFVASGLDPNKPHTVVLSNDASLQMLFNQARIGQFTSVAVVTSAQMTSSTISSIDASIVSTTQSIGDTSTATPVIASTSTPSPTSTSTLASPRSTSRLISPTESTTSSAATTTSSPLPILVPSPSDTSSTTFTSPRLSTAAIVGITLVSILAVAIVACIIYQCFRQRSILHQQSLHLDDEKGPSGFTSEAGFASTTDLLGDSAVESRLSRRSMAWVERSRGHLSWMSVEKRGDRLVGTKAFYNVPARRPSTPPPVPSLPLALSNSQPKSSTTRSRPIDGLKPLHLTPDNLAPFLSIPPRTPAVPSKSAPQITSYPVAQVPTPQAQASHHLRRAGSTSPLFWIDREMRHREVEEEGQRVMYADQASYYDHVGAMMESHSTRSSIPDSLRSSYAPPSARRLAGREI